MALPKSTTARAVHPRSSAVKKAFDTSPSIPTHELIGATALSYAPNTPNAGVYAVTALLLVGFGGLIWLRLRKAN